MHVEAKGAAIDLRGAHFHQFDEPRFEAAATDRGVKVADRRVGVRRRFRKIYPVMHRWVLLTAWFIWRREWPISQGQKLVG
jgi:hypothetical protein